MELATFLIGLAIGLVVAGIAGWLLGRASARATSDRDLAAQRERAAALEAQFEALRASLSTREESLAALQRDFTASTAREAEANATLQKEREVTAEKMALLEQARTALSDAFKALASDALSRNNQSFLELAKTALTGFQEQAQGDLAKRQQAIGELVKPVQEKLEAFNSRVGELEKARVGAYAQLVEQFGSLRTSQ